jgi:hypothetical protein
MSTSNKGTIRLYGAGGAGINCISIFNNVEEVPGCAKILTSYIDTSRSNIRPEFKEEDCYLLKGVDGSGKIRRENHREISESIKQILLEHKPGDFNVVVSSASGGSGSVIGPLIMAELLKRGESVVYCMIGSAECTVTATNTLNTLKSVAAISDRNDVPAVVYYEHNDDRPRSEVDNSIRYAIATLANLSSRQNAELDSKDISNWVRFNYSTGVPAQLALLDVYTDPDQVSLIKDPISIASLYNDPDQPKVKVVPEYSCVGYMTNQPKDYDQIHLVISTEGLESIYQKIGETVNDYVERREGRQTKLRIVSESDNVTDDNLVL